MTGPKVWNSYINHQDPSKVQHHLSCRTLGDDKEDVNRFRASVAARLSTAHYGETPRGAWGMEHIQDSLRMDEIQMILARYSHRETPGSALRMQQCNLGRWHLDKLQMVLDMSMPLGMDKLQMILDHPIGFG